LEKISSSDSNTEILIKEDKDEIIWHYLENNGTNVNESSSNHVSIASNNKIKSFIHELLMENLVAHGTFLQKASFKDSYASNWLCAMLDWTALCLKKEIFQWWWFQFF
jgi:hypothetical protein